MDEIVINVEFEKENATESLSNEVQVVSSEILWQDFELMLKVYADCDAISVLYWDDDDDIVPINSQDELSEAFRVARKSQNTLRMKVKCEGPPMADGDETLPGPDSSTDVDKEDLGCPCDIDVKRYFYLKNSGNLVLDVEAMNRSCGVRVILWDQKFSTNHQPQMLMNQLWYEDAATSTIRTAMNDFCLDIYGDQLVMNSYEADKASQKWSIEGSLVRWLGAGSGEWQVMGLKPPIDAHHAPNVYLYVGPLDTMTSTLWSKEFVYVGTPGKTLDTSQPFPPPWIQSYFHSLKKRDSE